MKLLAQHLGLVDFNGQFGEGKQGLLLPVNHSDLPQADPAPEVHRRVGILVLYKGEGEIEIKPAVFDDEIEIVRQIGQIVGEIDILEIDINL